VRSSCSSPRSRGRLAPPARDSDRRRRAALILAILLASGAGACASTGGSQVQGDLEAIQQQLWKMQKDNAALLDQVTALQNAPVPVSATDPASQETRLRIETIERDLRAMRARSEELDLRLGAVIAELRATREAIETVRRQTAAAPPPGTVSYPAPAGGPGATIGALPAVATGGAEDLY